MGRSDASSEMRGASGNAVAWSLRPQELDDLSTMRRIFLAIRRRPLDESGFDEATVERLAAYQFDLQRADYELSHPAARWDAIVVDGDVVGRLVTDDDRDATTVVDLMIDPLRRGEGTGSAVLLDLIERAGSRRVELDVDHDAASEAWLRRFGFELVNGDGPRRRLVRQPDTTPATV